MSDVFISYSRRNIDFARRLIDKLVLLGKDSWVDWEGIPLTSPNWWEEIKVGIESTDNFVFIISPDSMASVVCQMELAYALFLNKRIVPVIHQDVVIEDAFAILAEFEVDSAMQERLEGRTPLELAENNWRSLSHINWLFFRESDDFDVALKKLTDIVATNLDYVKSHTRYLTRAQEWERRERRQDLLLFGEEIDYAEAWLAQGDLYVREKETGNIDVVNPLPQALHRVYITSSREGETQRRRLLRNLRLGTAIFGMVGVVAVVLAIGSFFASQEAQTRADSASTQVADANQALTAVPPTLTQVAVFVQEGENRIESLRLASDAVDVWNGGRGNAETVALLAIRALNKQYTEPANLIALRAFDSLWTEAIFDEHSDWVESVAFSKDGRNILSGGSDGVMRLWDIETGELIRIFDTGAGTGNDAVAMSPDGALALSTARTGIQVWDVASGEMLRELQGHTDNISGVVFSPDGARILTSSWDATVRLWDVATGDIVRVFEHPPDYISSVALHPDGRRALSASWDGNLYLWDIETGELLDVWEGHDRDVNSAVFSPDGRHAVSGSWDNTMIVWDVEMGMPESFLSDDSGGFMSVDFSPDGRYVLSGMDNGTIELWDIEWQIMVKRLSGHSDRATEVVFSPDGRRAVSGSWDNTVRLWDIDIAESLYKAFGFGMTQTLALHPDGRHALHVVNEAYMVLWDIESDSVIRRYEVDWDYLTSVAISVDGQYAVTGSIGGSVYLWDVMEGDLLGTFEGHGDVVTSVAFHPDGQSFVSGSQDVSLMLWDVASGTLIQQFFGHIQPVRRVAFSPDGRYMASGSEDEFMRVWDVATAEELHARGAHYLAVMDVVFSPDSTRILTGSLDGTARLWDIETGEEVYVFGGYGGNIMNVAFSPDGRSILTHTMDDYLRLWDIETGEVFRSYQREGDSIEGVAFSSDGRLVYMTTASGRLVPWLVDYQAFIEALCQRVYRDLTPDERVRHRVMDDEATCPHLRRD